MITRFIANIKNKNISFNSDYSRAAFQEFLGRNEGRKVQIELAKNPVSDEMRGYYWAAIIPFFKSLEGWEELTHDQIHEVLKLEFNGQTIYDPIKKESRKIPKTIMSSESNTVAAMNYLESLRLYVSENYYKELPNPEDYKRLRDSARMN